MRVLFIGSDRFGVPSLAVLLRSTHEIVAVLGKPDRASGRGLQREATPVVQFARERSLRLFQPESLSEPDPVLEGFGWDVGVVVAYGDLIPRWLLRMPRYGIVNLHPSLLPRYRGAAPIERAIMNGANITGVTTIQMSERLDAGDILMHREEPVYEDDTAGTLKERLSHIGAGLLKETLDGLEKGLIERTPQEDENATYAPPVRKEEANVEWSFPAEKVDRLVRAFNPSPGAFTYFRGMRLKIWSLRLTDVPREGEPGAIVNTGKEGFLVSTGTCCVQPLILQPEGRSRMSSAEFSRGQRLLTGERFTREP